LCPVNKHLRQNKVALTPEAHFQKSICLGGIWRQGRWRQRCWEGQGRALSCALCRGCYIPVFGLFETSPFCCYLCCLQWENRAPCCAVCTARLGPRKKRVFWAAGQLSLSYLTAAAVYFSEVFYWRRAILQSGDTLFSSAAFLGHVAASRSECVSSSNVWYSVDCEPDRNWHVQAAMRTIGYKDALHGACTLT
jgi:hypothetical protein